VESNEDHDEYRQDLFRDLVYNCAELTVHVGMVGSIAHRWPDQVQENWREKLQGMIEWANQQIEEVQQFAEAFDPNDN
jgi:predicted secreted protein